MKTLRSVTSKKYMSGLSLDYVYHKVVEGHDWTPKRAWRDKRVPLTTVYVCRVCGEIGYGLPEETSDEDVDRTG